MALRSVWPARDARYAQRIVNQASRTDLDQGKRLSHTLEVAVSRFGKAATAKLRNPSATGEPEDQLRGPFESLVSDVAVLCGFGPGAVVTVGESSIAELKTRPDYAVTVGGAGGIHRAQGAWQRR